jgi:DNA-binding transcriptional MerR regulator
MSKSASAVNEADQPKELALPRARAIKAATAFRTISEVAEDLRVPQHVLRFWEGRFSQIKPLKRGGGRRYYRPEDIALLKRIHELLHVQGYTIKGVQRLIREGGGHLAENIPPPPPEEIAGLFEQVFAHTDEPQLPMPGLGPPALKLAPPSAPPAPKAKPVKVKPETPPPPPDESVLRAEVTLLRHLLRETLTELESIRALLPR